MCGNTKTAKYEVEEIGIANIPDLQDETKPYIINFRNGEEAPWQVLQCLIKNDCKLWCSVPSFIVGAEHNEKTLHYLNLEALSATAANNKEFLFAAKVMGFF